MAGAFYKRYEFNILYTFLSQNIGPTCSRDGCCGMSRNRTRTYSVGKMICLQSALTYWQRVNREVLFRRFPLTSRYFTLILPFVIKVMPRTEDTPTHVTLPQKMATIFFETLGNSGQEDHCIFVLGSHPTKRFVACLIVS